MDNKEITPKDALEYLVNTGKAIQTAEATPHVVEIEDSTYMFYRGNMQRVTPKDDPTPDTFTAYTLCGLVDYIRTDVDKLFSYRNIVRVSSAIKVEVFAPVGGYELKRACIATCDAKVPTIRFDAYMDAEDFMLMLMTRFHDDDAHNRDLLMKLAGNLREEQSMQTADDGFSQKVTIKKGIASVGDVVVKNPVYLAPRRTFNEVAAPVSPFVVRFKEGGQVALFEADGGAWKDEAVKRIGAWLDAALAECNVEVIA